MMYHDQVRRPAGKAPDLLMTKAGAYFRSYQQQLAIRVDRSMAALLAIEWIGAVVAALILSPRTWSGGHSAIHPHVWIAILAGPFTVLAPVTLVLLYPGRTLTRHVVAAAQIFTSILLIDVTNGRIETHFHVFGSLAFLAFYRDWRVLVTASAITAVDHIVRGIWWPQSVYGVLMVSPWRWVEHAWWVIFEDVFLVWSSNRSLHDMWELATREARLSEGAHHDVLTGLANRRLLQDRFDRCLSMARETAVGSAILFVDLDRFKQVNDVLGHTIGDKLLVQVAERLSCALRAKDTIARIGGDEFVVLIDHIDSASDAEAVGEKLISVLNQPFQVEGNQLLLSASIGIALCPEHGAELAVLQEAADQAMYMAKASGRNRIAVFSEEMIIRANMRADMEHDLDQAVNRGEMELHFQPLLGPMENVTGFEALLRWTHPVLGAVPPSEFIPMAERSGAIDSIGEWVLRKTCMACAGWRAEGYADLRVAVNISAVQFGHPGFIRLVENVLEETALDPSLLILELTETAVLKDLALTKDHLMRLRQAGINISLDDFGTGYSSLTYLHTLPADTIKLDRAFVSHAFSESQVVLRSTIKMAHELGLRVVAEGVETLEQRTLLHELECDELQGFYFNEPMPEVEVMTFMRSRAYRDSLETIGT